MRNLLVIADILIVNKGFAQGLHAIFGCAGAEGVGSGDRGWIVAAVFEQQLGVFVRCVVDCVRNFGQFGVGFGIDLQGDKYVA